MYQTGLISIQITKKIFFSFHTDCSKIVTDILITYTICPINNLSLGVQYKNLP